MVTVSGSVQTGCPTIAGRRSSATRPPTPLVAGNLPCSERMPLDRQSHQYPERPKRLVIDKGQTTPEDQQAEVDEKEGNKVNPLSRHPNANDRPEEEAG